MTIHESEEVDFRSEFHRNSSPKGFKDTKWKHDYLGVVWGYSSFPVNTLPIQYMPHSCDMTNLTEPASAHLRMHSSAPAKAYNSQEELPLRAALRLPSNL